jgi:hypothetical protein
MDLLARAAAIEDEATALVAELPTLPPARLAALAAELDQIAAAAPVDAAGLAEVLAAVVAVYQDGRAVLEGWAVVASAAHTLRRVLAAPDAGHAAALAAVRFELETLLPPIERGPRAVAVAADVPVAALVRRT